tara:strand:- start:241 stop:744 length:504 start_codon:yes stop_codon:yes gene_type:complete
MKSFRFFLGVCEFIIEFFGKIASSLIPLLILIISISVILRYFFSLGFTWLQDLYIWIHASIILLGIAYTLKHDSHVRIDLIYRNSTKKFKSLINIFGTVFFTLPFSCLLIMKAFPYFHRSFLLNEASKESGGLPAVYILKFIIFLMGVSLIVYVLSNFLKFVIQKWK